MKLAAAFTLAFTICTSIYTTADAQEGCPLEFDNNATYKVGDKVRDNRVVFECKSAHCSQVGFEPLSTYSDLAWTVLGFCDGTVAPTTSPNFSSLTEVGDGCPSSYDSSDAYVAGDLVSLDSIVYECMSSGSEYCNAGSNFAPGSDNASLGWDIKGYCDGTASPTTSPTAYAPAQKCRWYNGTQPITISLWSASDLSTYEAGTRVRKGTTIYKCKSFPFSLWCKTPGYEPEVGLAWKESWSMAGECNGQFEPTFSPTASPSSTPTTAPTAAPTISDFPSLSPSSAPSQNPSELPSSVPSLSPSVIPSGSPSSHPSICPVTNAVFDSNYGVPRCESASHSCDTGSLVVGRGQMDEGIEPNLSNTLDGCVDGNDGDYYDDESIERIVVKADGCQELRAGELATIVATVYVYDDEDDTADFFYAANASNPVWVYIGSENATVSDGLTDIEMTYTIPSGSDVQAVRVQFTYNEGPSTDPCINNDDYNDRDDVVFKVLP